MFDLIKWSNIHVILIGVYTFSEWLLINIVFHCKLTNYSPSVQFLYGVHQFLKIYIKH